MSRHRYDILIKPNLPLRDPPSQLSRQPHILLVPKQNDLEPALQDGERSSGGEFVGPYDEDAAVRSREEGEGEREVSLGFRVGADGGRGGGGGGHGGG